MSHGIDLEIDLPASPISNNPGPQLEQVDPPEGPQTEPIQEASLGQRLACRGRGSRETKQGGRLGREVLWAMDRGCYRSGRGLVRRIR
jgi:hypothetical protein